MLDLASLDEKSAVSSHPRHQRFLGVEKAVHIMEAADQQPPRAGGDHLLYRGVARLQTDVERHCPVRHARWQAVTRRLSLSLIGAHRIEDDATVDPPLDQGDPLFWEALEVERQSLCLRLTDAVIDCDILPHGTLAQLPCQEAPPFNE